MRQFTPLTNLVLALVAAAALAAALGFPWYALSDPPGPAAGDEGAIESTGATIVSWFGASGTTVTGADALATAETILLALAGATAGLAMAMVLPPLRGLVRELLRLVPLAAPVVVAVQVLSPPDGMEIRFGALAALALAAIMASSAFHGAELRVAGASSARPRRPAGGPAGPPGAR